MILCIVNVISKNLVLYNAEKLHMNKWSELTSLTLWG